MHGKFGLLERRPDDQVHLHLVSHKIDPSSSDLFSQGFGFSLEIGGLAETRHGRKTRMVFPNIKARDWRGRGRREHEPARATAQRPSKKERNVPGGWVLVWVLVWRCNRRSKFISPSRSLIRSSVPFRSSAGHRIPMNSGLTADQRPCARV